MSAAMTVDDFSEEEEAVLRNLAQMVVRWRRTGRAIVRTAKFWLPLAVFLYYALAIWQKVAELPVHLPLWWR